MDTNIDNKSRRLTSMNLCLCIKWRIGKKRILEQQMYKKYVSIILTYLRKLELKFGRLSLFSIPETKANIVKA